MSAMTWWDHETGSVWSQPWGMAIDGALRGTTLELVPAGIVPWGTWFGDHPETLVMVSGASRQDGVMARATSNYVIGVTLDEYAAAYPFKLASEEVVINDRLGPFPVLVLADPESKAVHVYLRTIGDRELEFSLSNWTVVDAETGSTWDFSTGTAVGGALEGRLLQRLPYVTPYDWAWEDFYPHSEFYGSKS